MKRRRVEQVDERVTCRRAKIERRNIKERANCTLTSSLSCVPIHSRDTVPGSSLCLGIFKNWAYIYTSISLGMSAERNNDDMI